MSKRYIDIKDFSTCSTSEDEFITRCDVCGKYLFVNIVEDVIHKWKDEHYDYYQYECLCGVEIIIRD